jgi:hypothetical protein
VWHKALHKVRSGTLQIGNNKQVAKHSANPNGVLGWIRPGKIGLCVDLTGKIGLCADLTRKIGLQADLTAQNRPPGGFDWTKSASRRI